MFIIGERPLLGVLTAAAAALLVTAAAGWIGESMEGSERTATVAAQPLEAPASSPAVTPQLLAVAQPSP